MQDEPLSPDEQEELASLPREMSPPDGLEDRVVGALRQSGHLSRTGRRWPGLVAAAMVLLAVGFGAGRLASDTPGDAGGDRYLLLLYGGDSATATEESTRVAEYAAWAGEEREAGRLIAAERLSDVAEVFGARAGAPDASGGPSGYFLIRASTAEEAAAVASSCPHLDYGGTVVLRPVG